MRTSPVILAGLSALMLATTALAGCSPAQDRTIADKDKLVIGVKYDQPSLGLRTTDGLQGYDIDVAKYIANHLGVSDENIEFKEARSANRESFLQNGTVDMILGNYTITDARKPKVTFAGPYAVAHQDIIVRADNTDITSLADLNGKRVCQVSGSNSWKNIVEGTNLFDSKVSPILVPAEGYTECMTKLRGNSIDAVSADNTMLAGFIGQDGAGVKLVNAPFTDERYAVGLTKGDVDGCAKVDEAIAAMYADGTATKLWQKWFGAAGLPAQTAQPPVESCA